MSWAEEESSPIQMSDEPGTREKKQCCVADRLDQSRNQIP